MSLVNKHDAMHPAGMPYTECCAGPHLHELHPLWVAPWGHSWPQRACHHACKDLLQAEVGVRLVTQGPDLPQNHTKGEHIHLHKDRQHQCKVTMASAPMSMIVTLHCNTCRVIVQQPCQVLLKVACNLHALHIQAPASPFL